MTKSIVAIALGLLAVSGCTRHEMTAPVAVQEATAGQDNSEIVLPFAIIGGLALWGVN